ncbi:MupG family TIM beta-alpha barrel fold protein [Erysipelothrix piscisicarius]|uniref:MupG family TIM beta-alpha barrel fold protein n=1 Tax=Erysipelothrix piscisicarius TaxID=2485784 RepID=UPI002F92531D
MLGISSYFKDLDYGYLEAAAAIGVKYLFTSLHIPEEDLSKLDQEMPKFLAEVKRLGLELVPDISPATFEKLGIKPNDYQALKELGFTSLRLDYGFDDFEIVKALQKDFDLMLNASVVNEPYILDALEAGVDFNNISVLHNFYPKTETGLSLDYFKKINEVFIRHKIKIMAFVPGDALKRFPLYEGLPTVEKHRQCNPYLAAVELMHDCGITDILIGDSKAHLETLFYIESYMKDSIMHIPAFFSKHAPSMYDKTFEVRKDLSEHVIRMLTPRIPGIPVMDNGARVRGAITIENELSGRYSGEMQICKKAFPMDARTNVIGFIHPDYVDLVFSIDRYTKIKFVRID